MTINLKNDSILPKEAVMTQKLNPGRLTVFIAVLLVFATVDIFAQSVRSRGMGGAFIAISDDESATFYNPAGLSQIQGREGSVQTKVNERDVFNWSSISFTGHIYQDSPATGFSIADYLEHNILKEPIPRRPKYSYGMSYTRDQRSEEFGEIVGGDYLGVRRKLRDLQLAFGTRFPIARRMLAREQLYGGLKFRYTEVDRRIKSLQQHSSRDSASMGIGLMYHYNDQITTGLTVNNIWERVRGTNARTDGISMNMGVAMELTRGTIVSADVVNLTGSARDMNQQYRVGVEKKFVENDLALRMGSLNGTLTLGFGMHLLPHVRVDYAYYDGELISEHYVGAHVTFD